MRDSTEAGDAGDGTGASAADSDPLDEEPDMEDVLDDLEALERIVDSPAEREQVREAMRTARRARTPRVFGRIRDSFDLRDAGEAVVGAFVFGIPMVVEGGTQEIGVAIADSIPVLAFTAGFGMTIVLGILHAARFEAVESDFLPGVIPRRLLGILAIATGMAFGLMTVWDGSTGRRRRWRSPSAS